MGPGGGYTPSPGAAWHLMVGDLAAVPAIAASLLRVPAGIVALTKIDVADAEMIELARLEVRELAAGSFLEGAPVVPVSALSGAGLDDLRTALVHASGALATRQWFAS